MTSPAREPAAEHPAPTTPPPGIVRRRRLPTALEVALGRRSPRASTATARARYDAAIADLDPEQLAEVIAAAETAGHGAPGPYPPPGDIVAFDDARRT